MTPNQSALATPPHRNQQLFSDYYLNYILARSSDWRALTERAALLLQEVQAIWAAFVPSANEAQTEDGLIKPVLLALGHTFEVQAALRTPDGTKRPDYLFYRDAPARDALKGATLDDALPSQGCFAVGDAKHWDRPLDMALKLKGGDHFNNKNPAFQIHFYMQHSGVEWGILTNGRRWRLYHKETAHKLDRFYEIDLPALLARKDPADFLYFYAFFHRSAFDDHPLGLRTILRSSTEFARGISDNLKEQVYDALRCIAQGLLDYQPNGLGHDPATLKTIYDHSLIVLYRLLFVFYAEARELLPLRANGQYRKFYSLHALKKAAADVATSGEQMLVESTLFWHRLQYIFRAINAGYPALAIATFNGGLFDPAKHPFLEEKIVGDARLLQAIDMLARVGGKFIDYRDLAERHLGTIYEGLLEYHLEAIAPEQHWTIALLNDKGERKASGSYYTPDYIVKYIVDQTVGPALRRAVAGLEDDAAKIRAVLAVSVCDPAMGSGHFLVEATEYIARFLVDQALLPDEATDEADLAYWKRRVAQSCIYGVDLNPLAVDLAKLSLWLATVAQDRPLSFLDHHLRCGNALIGGRLADLALGAAAPQPGKTKKATTPTAQLALFSDDAFRRSISTAVDNMWLIEAKAANTVDEVKEQERIYDELRAALTHKYGRLANLASAKHFGLNAPAELNTPLIDYASGRVVAAMPEIDDLLKQADAIAAERRFFHWELEFPEIFFDRTGQPLGDKAGFAVVVGNPPYIRSINLKSSDIKSWEYYANSFQSTNTREYDIYMAFAEQGFYLLKKSAKLGFILPNKWMTTSVGESLRRIISEHQSLAALINFRDFQVFAKVTTYTCLLFLIHAPQSVATITTLQRAESLDKPLPEISGIWQQKQVATSDLGAEPWHSAFGVNQDLLAKITKEVTLQQVALIFKGTGTSADQVYFMQRAGKRYFSRSLDTWLEIEHELMRPALTGRDIDPYLVKEDNYLLFPYSLTDGKAVLMSSDEIAARYPKAWRYLNEPTNRAMLMERDHGKFANRLDWYCYSYPRSMHLLHLQKLVLPDVAGRAEFAYDHEGRYIIDTAYGLRLKPETNLSLLALCAMLNSGMLTFFLQQTGTNLRGGYFRMKTAYLAPFPLPSITFTTPEAERAALLAEGVAHYAAGRQAELLHFCKERLAAVPEQSDVVHDVLAHLAQQMLELHKQRQRALEDLLLDLEGVLAPGLLEQLGRLYTPPRPPQEDDKNLAAKQAKYAATLAAATAQLGALATRRLELRDDIGSLSEAQWKWLVKQRLKHKLGSMADLVKIYRSRQPAIAALDQRIAATDHLIDQIVYALYGLDDAEIALVEGGGERPKVR